MDRPSVCFITDSPGDWSFGRIADALGRGFDRIGERFDVVYLKGVEGERNNGSVRAIGLGGVRGRSAIAPLARYLRSARPHMTLASPGYLAPAAVVAGKLSRQAVVPWEPTFLERHLPELPLRMRLLPILQRATYPRARAVAVVSEDVGEHVRTHRSVDRGRVYRLPNPVDSEYVRERASERCPFERRGFTLCTVGRLHRQKGHDVLLDALCLRGSDLPDDWSLIALGKGGQRPRLEETARRIGIEDRVRFAGYCDNPYPIMRNADVLVHPSRSEGFGLVLLEAMCLGVPILATRCPGGPREILGDGDFGWLVPAEDPASLGDALVRLTRRDEERRSLAERGRVRSHAFSPEIVAAMALSIAGRLFETE